MDIILTKFNDVAQTLKDGGYRFKKQEYEKYYQDLITAWDICRVHLATANEADRMASKIMRKLHEDIEPIKNDI